MIGSGKFGSFLLVHSQRPQSSFLRLNNRSHVPTNSSDSFSSPKYKKINLYTDRFLSAVHRKNRTVYLAVPPLNSAGQQIKIRLFRQRNLALNWTSGLWSNDRGWCPGTRSVWIENGYAWLVNVRFWGIKWAASVRPLFLTQILRCIGSSPWNFNGARKAHHSCFEKA